MLAQIESSLAINTDADEKKTQAEKLSSFIAGETGSRAAEVTSVVQNISSMQNGVSHEFNGEFSSELRKYLFSVRAKVEMVLQSAPKSHYRFRGGETQVRVSLNPDGSILLLEIVNPSGNKEADETALQTIQKSAPFPAFNDRVTSKEVLSFILPIRFQVL